MIINLQIPLLSLVDFSSSDTEMKVYKIYISRFIQFSTLSNGINERQKASEFGVLVSVIKIMNHGIKGMGGDNNKGIIKKRSDGMG